MPRYIDADALKQRVKNNWYTSTEIMDDIDAEPTADVVEKEWHDILLEHANILAEELRKYQNADVPEKNVGKWIPVTEQLPKDGCYLCTYENDEGICVDIGRVIDGEWYVMPTAWMPLPEPYRKETEDG